MDTDDYQQTAAIHATESDPVLAHDGVFYPWAEVGRSGAAVTLCTMGPDGQVPGLYLTRDEAKQLGRALIETAM